MPFRPSLVTASFLSISASLPALAAAGPQDTALIPRAVLFGNPDKTSARISPDGRHIAYLAPKDGVLNVWVAPTGSPDKARPVTADATRGIRQYQWAYTGNHILYLQDLGGDENWKIFAVDLTQPGAPARDLTPFEHIMGPDGKPIMQPNGKPLRPAARISNVSERFPDTIVVALNNRNPQYHDLLTCNIRTGQLTLLVKNDQFGDITVDDDYAVRIATRTTPGGAHEVMINRGPTRPGADTPVEPAWELLTTIPFEDALTTDTAGFDKSGNILYFTETRGRNTAALTALDLTSNKTTIVAENPRADVGGVISHPTEKTIQAVAFNYLRTEWTVLDKSIQPDLDYLKTVTRGEIQIGSRSLDDTQWTVNFLLDDGPVKTYLYDRKARAATFLFSNRESLNSQPLAPMHAFTIKTRDGLDMVSYLTLPVASDTDGDGRPASPLPTVLLVHGGPWARDQWGYNGYHQWLANRGYAVLSVNFRGSVGFGKHFVNAGNKEWAAKMHDDLIDAVNWATQHKVADPAKVAIMGGSYGGYATLVGLTFTPTTFACGVDIVGPSNITTLLNTIPPYWASFVEQMAERVGDWRTEEGRAFLESRSPLSRVDQIKRPLLIGQGANDPRVKQSEADQIVQAMTARNIPVTYILFPDEGHGFARPENSKAFNAVTEAFLAEHLGGRVQPIGDDFAGSSITAPAGAGNVKGLKDALPH